MFICSKIFRPDDSIGHIEIQCLNAMSDGNVRLSLRWQLSRTAKPARILLHVYYQTQGWSFNLMLHVEATVTSSAETSSTRETKFAISRCLILRSLRSHQTGPSTASILTSTPNAPPRNRSHHPVRSLRPCHHYHHPLLAAVFGVG